MKRFLTILVTTLLLSTVLCMTASASDFDTVAEELSTIGMFRGTSKGFELDRAPTRSEAAIMLVRLYGAEEEAKAAYEAGEISHPFNDVSPFSSPYVAWLYTNGIAGGTSETTFSSARACTAKNYAAFLLRALGYQDGVDFQYADTLAFAQEKGFYDPILFSGEFLRDDLAALTYQGLAADMADGKTYLLDSLIADGSIDKSAAKPITEKIEAYRAMTSAMAETESTSMDMDMVMQMDMTMTVEGESLTMATETSGNMQMVLVDDTHAQLAYDMTTTMDGISSKTGMWLKDGWQYMSVDDGTQVLKVKSPVDDSMAALEEMGAVDMTAMDVSELATIQSISSKKVGLNTEYTLLFSENIGGSMDAINELLGEDAAGLEMSIGEIKAVYTLDRKGNLKEVAMVFSAAMQMDMPMEDGSVISADVVYDYDMTMTINAMGDAVKITWPDFSDFVEMPAGEADSLA